MSHTIFGHDMSEVNHTTYHVLETIAAHTQLTEEDITVEEYYTHTYIQGEGAETFVDKFCSDRKGDFQAKLKKSPLTDDVDYYHYAIK